MNKPVLVLVMSQQCPACSNFKKKMLPELEKEFKNDSRIRFVLLDFPKMEIPISKDGKDYHPELRNGFVEFFPTFLLFPGNLWNNKDSKLKGVAKHVLSKNPKPDYSKASIVNWIDETIRKDPLFTNNSNVILADNTKPMAPKQLEDGKYLVPTYGTYNRFKASRIDETL
jgi:thiol-disulfide isomerase/thioredoxin